MALIVVLGVMNGLRNDLRDRILVANPHLRILTFGPGLRIDDWREVLAEIRRDPAVEAAAPEVISESLITTGADYAEARAENASLAKQIEFVFSICVLFKALNRENPHDHVFEDQRKVHDRLRFLPGGGCRRSEVIFAVVT